MDIDENLNFMLQRMINEAMGKPIFILDHNFTQRLKVGSFIKIVGYASGKDGSQVTDMEIVEVRSQPKYTLAYEKSHYVLAREGLFMDLKKKQESCPNSHSTLVDLDQSDWSRLHCSLTTIDQVMIRELQRCEI